MKNFKDVARLHANGVRGDVVITHDAERGTYIVFSPQTSTECITLTDALACGAELLEELIMTKRV